MPIPALQRRDAVPPCWGIITLAASRRKIAGSARSAGGPDPSESDPLPNQYPNPAPCGVFCARCLSVFTSHKLWGYSLRRRHFLVFGMGGIQAADLPRRRIYPPVFSRVSGRFAGELQKTPPRIYFNSPPQPVTRGAGAAPPAPSETHRGTGPRSRTLGRGPGTAGRVAVVMTF